MSELRSDPRRLLEADSWSAELDAVAVVFGEGSLEQLGTLARRLGMRSVLLVTDPGLRAAGHAGVAARLLEHESLRVTVFDGVAENPSTQHVEAGRELAAAARVDGIVALGGGSALDCAKGINFVLTNGGRMEDYWGRDKAKRPMLPSVGVPTTAGTGSEAQSFALISQEGTGVKMACGDRQARFRAVVLDPALLASVPHEVAAIAGIDAVSHAVESYVTTERNAVSQLFAREAWRLLEANLEKLLADRGERRTRAAMLLGAFFAGTAIEHSMLGAAHACANPLTARFGVTHGIAVGLMLPEVVRFNAVEVAELYHELNREASEAARRDGVEQRVRSLRAAAGLPGKLRDYAVDRGCLDTLAEEASRQWTAAYNPRRVGREELRELYESAY